MVVFGKRVEPCGNGKVLPYCLFTVLFSIGIHVQDQHAYEAAGIGGYAIQGACLGYGLPVLQLVKDPAG